MAGRDDQGYMVLFSVKLVITNTRSCNKLLCICATDTASTLQLCSLTPGSVKHADSLQV